MAQVPALVLAPAPAPPLALEMTLAPAPAPTGAGPMLAEEYPLDVVPVLEMLLAFEAAKNALV